MKATVFKNFTQPVEHRSLILITKDIIEGRYKTEVEEIRALIAAGKKAEADKKKKQLPGFTASATFSEGRKMEFFQEYSGFIILDIDKLAPIEYALAFEKAQTCLHTFFAFRSPGGNGLKILVKVSAGKQHHELAYGQVANYYAQLLGVALDRTGKDITRLCFISYDPEAFKNLDCTVFPVQIPSAQNLPAQTPAAETPIANQNTTDANLAKFAKLFQQMVEFTQNKKQFAEGNRNNFVYQLSCNCNRLGIPLDVALQLIRQQFGYDDGEVRATIKSAYQNHTAEFASFANFAGSQNYEPEVDLAAQLMSTPLIPEEVFTNLPNLLKDGCKAFPDARERDVFLTGAITILSGCFTSLSGIYDGRLVYPNLFSFIVAPAASGKGSLVYARKLGNVIHNSLLTQSREAQQLYESQMEQVKNLRHRKKQADPSIETQTPEKPKFKVLFIPANSSTAAVMSHLDQNDGLGIICETEADTMGNTLKQDWGGYSDLMRKAFHHETASSSRKTDKEYIQVQTPRLTVALSGTPSQVIGLISSAEDGLFSRFMFYTFKTKPVWRSVAPGPGLNLTAQFQKLSERLANLAAVINATETIFHFTQKQWAELDAKFTGHLKEVSAFISEDASSTVKRLGLITYRIAMVLAAIRNAEDAVAESSIACSDVDFNIAMSLSEVYLQHALLMFKSLPHSPRAALDVRKRKFWEALPTGSDFPRSEAVAIGAGLNIKERTVGKYLSDLLGAFLSEGEQYGYYRKL